VSSREDHPTSREVIERFAAGTASPDERRRFIRHLLQGCQQCTANLREVLRGGERTAPAAYHAAIDKALHRVLAETEGHRSPAPAVNLLLAELDRQPELRRETVARNIARFHSVPLLDALVERSYGERYGDLTKMLVDARIATRIAEVIVHEGRAGTMPAASAVCKAWAQLGNALRIAGQHVESDQAFARAVECLQELPASAATSALVYDRFATLRKDQRNFEAAKEYFGRAITIYRALKDGPHLGRSLLSAAINDASSGNNVAALEGILEASPLLDAKSEPSLALSALLTAARAYVDENMPERALSVFTLGQELYRASQSPFVALKIQWTEGVLLSALKHHEAARNLLEETRAAYISAGQSYNCALVSLDLATVLANMGHYSEVRTLISQSLPVFNSLAVHREIYASIILLAETVRPTNCVEILRKVAARLQRDPLALDLAATR
jgi:tetratricopeptide (TPR) repeat protein